MEFSLKTSESFNEVMLYYTPMVYRIAFTRLQNTADAEDVSQDVFLRYFKADKTYDSEEHRMAWLIHCAVNCANTAASSSWNRHKADAPDLEGLSDTLQAESSLEENAERKETRESVLKAVMELPAKYRTVIYLFYFEDMPTVRIAEVTDSKEATVRSQLSRAREMLKKKFRKLWGEAEFDDL